jgi:hypothetical protein
MVQRAKSVLSPVTLDEARRQFESRFEVWHEIGDHSLSPTGEPYVEVCSGGVKGDAERIAAVGTSEAAAIKLWLQAANEYADGKTGTLYWRVVPEIDSINVTLEGYDSDHGLTDELRDAYYKRKNWIAYSRFLISDKPRIRSAILSKNAA